MQTIVEQETCRRYRKLIGEMTESAAEQADQFSSEWLLNKGWTVVPVEDVAHFSPEQRENITDALNRAGHSECIAIATEQLGDAAECYRVVISAKGLEEFNRECGMFRFLLTAEDRSWAISCTESYNLFAARPKLLEGMLGKPIKEAWQAYWDFINLPSMDPNGLLHRTANRYASLLADNSQPRAEQPQVVATGAAGLHQWLFCALPADRETTVLCTGKVRTSELGQVWEMKL